MALSVAVPTSRASNKMVIYFWMEGEGKRAARGLYRASRAGVAQQRAVWAAFTLHLSEAAPYTSA